MRLQSLALALLLLLPASDPLAAQDAPEDDLETAPAEPDFTVITLPTNLRLPRHKVAFRLTHRFARPLSEGDFGDLLADLFGFDSGAQIGLGLRRAPLWGKQPLVFPTNDPDIQFSPPQE